MQQVDDPPSLPVGTEVSAKYKGAFCEAKVSKVVRNIKVKVAYKHGLGSGIVPDDAIKATPGQLRVGAIVEVRHPDRKEYVEATVTKIQDGSQYTVVFDDGDITTLRRTALCLKSGRHFNESETLDQLPLTHPEHFGNPVVGGRRGRRRGHTNEDSSDEEDESETKEVINEKEENIGKVVCVETESKKKDKEKWFPGLVVSPTAQATARIRVKDEYLVRSFKDGRYYTVPKKEATEFTREAAAKQDSPAVQAALEYLDSNVLPAHWDRDALFGLSNSTSEEDEEVESDSSDDEPREEKDHFVAQLYKYMDDRGTPLNKVPSIQSKDVDLYRLFRAVQKRGGYNRVTTQNQWKPIAIRLGFTPVTVSVTNLVKQAYKKFLQPYGEFNRKLGCSMLMTPRNSNRSKGRSLVRASSVASPKPADTNKDAVAKLAQIANIPSTSALTVNPTPTPTPSSAPVTASVTQSAAEESENTSESSLETTKKKRKISVGAGKVKSLVEKFEEKIVKDEADVPLSKIKAAVAASRSDEKEKDNKETVKEAPVSKSPPNREPSPSGSVTSNKKEKIQRKPPVQNEEKRGKRKKEEITYEKVEAGDFYVEIGDKLKVYYTEKKDKSTYEAKVIEIVLQQETPMYLVHYTGWNTRYDEWVPRERIAENITKGYKQKGRNLGNGGNASIPEKIKENPPKPPIAASAPSNSSNTVSSSTSTVAKTPSTAKRGRGRSDSLPPRSTTPSSVASNSSRTKSPAASNVKRRPTRVIPNSARRTSTNVSDVSIPTESDTDSDEPVKRPTRNLKEQSHKMAPNMSNLGKSPNKGKRSISAANSQTESEDDQNEENETQSSSLKIVSNNSSNSSKMGAKGRDYDLNEIRSELKGFQDLKSPTPPSAENVAAKELSSVKCEIELDVQSNTSTKDACSEIKDIKTEIEPKAEPLSETDSCADDDSQSSDKTTTLENMTEKFQQKINADKQRSLEKQSLNKGVSNTRVVEKIIKESLAEKRQEGLKAKPQLKEEKIKLEEEIDKFLTESISKIDEDEEESSTSSTQVNEAKSSIIAPARFGNTSGGKYTSVIVEKPLSSNVAKKTENVVTKKNDTNKKVIDKEIINIETPAACSPSSSSSSSSAFSTSSVSTRSLPDMSKLDISGSSSSASLYSSIISQETKFSQNISKPISPDIYEFKDPEPFEFEIRKSPLVLSSTSLSLNSTVTSSSTTNTLQTSSRKQTQKQIQQDQSIQNPMSALMNRKKRGSPMKDSNTEKSKQHKMEEKSLTNVSDNKAIHNTTVTTPQTGSNVTKTSPTQNKSVTITITSTHGALLAPPPPNVGNQKTDPSTHTPFDVLRKSPSFNINKNTLNEELAQTLQETARALTDALPPPTTPTIPGTPVTETTPTKLDPTTSVCAKNQNTTKVTSPKFVTPPKQSINTKAVVGSPFLETRKDIISNVFETSLSVASSSNTESKDNKFDLKNAKILLSASAGAFDLQPPNFENKPTSIADKVLKAISQKKEEVESKNKETKEECDKDKITEPSASKETEATKQKLGIITVTIPTNTSNEGALTGTEFLLQEPLKINTDLPTSSTSLLSGGKDYTGLDKVLQSPVLCKSTTLISPEPRLSMFETIGKKNTDLTETIQKLECAIQKKNIVSSVPITATAAVTDHFSDDSTDSTDSRLVIEDVSEEPADVQKSPISAHQADSRSDLIPLKIDESKKIISNIVIPEVTIQAAMPLKLISPGKQAVVTSTITLPANVASANFASKLQASSTVLYETKPTIESASTSAKTVTQAQPHIVQQVHTLPNVQIISSHKSNAMNSETKVKESEHTLMQNSDSAFKAATLQSQTQRAATVVPIVLPDIPVSVVVASSAVPSVVAAAQAAAAAAIKNTTQKQTILSGINIPSSSSVPIVTSASSSTFAANSASLKTFETAAAVRNVSILKTIPVSLPVSQQNNTFMPTSTVTGSGFYLDARTELRPDDGLKLIVDNVNLEKSGHLIELPGDDFEASTSTGIVADAQNEAINLLCEETIPGSPVPSFGGKDEPITTTQASIVQTITPNNKLDYNTIVDMPSTSGAQNIQATGSIILVSTSSSTPDSVSQDDSSEDLKKNAEIDEVSPRKRRRTRQQSEVSAVNEVHQKRRKYTTSKRTTAGSDSDDNSDNVSNTRQQLHHQPQLPQMQAQTSTKAFPYNFLVELDPSLNCEQTISILQKQISDLRKTYILEKTNLASIDRRRKKLRRREREKKQLQNQQVKIQS